MGFEYLLRLDTISEVLSTRRGDLVRKSEYLSGTAMSKALNKRFGKKLARSQAWISLLENGADSADIMTLQPEVRLELLRLYAFTDTEIAQLSERFKLSLERELNADVKNFTPRPHPPTGTLEYPVRSLRTPTEGGPVLLTQALLGTHRADDVLTITAGGDLLACETVKRTLQSGWQLFFDAARTPLEGQEVIYRVGNADRYLLVRYGALTERYYTSYDGEERERITPGETPLELLGVFWRYIPPESYPDEKTVKPS